MSTLSKLLWVTNVPTPYRQPVWLALSTLVDMDVVCMELALENQTWRPEQIVEKVQAFILNAPAISFGHQTRLYLPTVSLVRTLARRYDAIVIDGWESPAYVLCALMARLLGKTLVLYYRGTSSSNRFRRGPVALLRTIMLRAGHYVIIGGQESAKVVQAAGVRSSRIISLGNPVDVQRFARTLPTTQFNSDRQDQHHFIYVGQLIPRKNVARLVRSFAELVDTADQRVHLSIVGSGPEDIDIKRVVSELAIENFVSFTGGLAGEQLVAALQSADTLVLPSTQEVYGLVVPEALAAGLHVVVSESCGCVPEVRNMRGVYVFALDNGLTDQMNLSMSDWRGPISSPEILSRTPESFAADLLAIIDT